MSSMSSYLTPVPCRLPFILMTKGGSSEITCNVPFAKGVGDEFEGGVVFAGELATRAMISCEATYVLTARDIDALEIVSTTSVQALDKFDEQVVDSTTSTTSLEQVGNINDNVKDVYHVWVRIHVKANATRCRPHLTYYCIP